MMLLITFVAMFHLVAYVASSNQEAACFSSSSSSAQISILYPDRYAAVDPIAKKSAATLTACAMLCVASKRCRSANAIRINKNQIECQLLDRRMNTEELSTFVNATFIMPQEKSCDDLHDCSDPRLSRKDKVITIVYPNGLKGVVSCDQATNGGAIDRPCFKWQGVPENKRSNRERSWAIYGFKLGWLVFQRRKDGSVDFNRDWKSYKEGFGNITGEFWLGLDKIHNLVRNGKYILRIDMKSEDSHYYAKYSNFTVSDETNGYRINWTKYEGNAGDSLARHRLMKFSTVDQDNDVADSKHCALHYGAPWWHESCFDSSLNGEYGCAIDSRGVNWKTAKGYRYSFPFVEMKIKMEP